MYKLTETSLHPLFFCSVCPFFFRAVASISRMSNYCSSDERDSRIVFLFVKTSCFLHFVAMLWSLGED